MTPRKVLFSLIAACGLALAVGPAFAGDGPSADDGKKIFTSKQAKCSKCHGEDGKGQTKMGKKVGVPDMTSADWQKSITDDQIKEIVLKGREKTDKKKKHKALKDAKPEQADALVAFIRSLAPAEAAPKK
jgi:mono/diheme cytochrome c family protein